MPLIIGTDEAGYGPNLGPLVISASVWESSVAPQSVDLEHALDELATADDPKLAIRIADSKQVYTPKSGVGFLESAIFSFLATIDQQPASWRELVQGLNSGQNTGEQNAGKQNAGEQNAGEQKSSDREVAWSKPSERKLPIAIDSELLASQCLRVAAFMQDSPLRFQRAVSRIIEPGEFNELCVQLGNKATVLTESTLQIVREVIDRTDETDVLVVCDKHGGRSKYGAVLQAIFQEGLVRVGEEKPNCSVYNIDVLGKSIEIRFIAKGERMFPIALASIFSKYLRELSMMAFNEYWLDAVPGIKRTAGYPVDAKRFAEEIAGCATRLKLSRSDYWRNR